MVETVQRLILTDFMELYFGKFNFEFSILVIKMSIFLNIKNTNYKKKCVCISVMFYIILNSFYNAFYEEYIKIAFIPISLCMFVLRPSVPQAVKKISCPLYSSCLKILIWFLVYSVISTKYRVKYEFFPVWWFLWSLIMYVV